MAASRIARRKTLRWQRACALGFGVGLGSCSGSPVVVPTRTFDRPVDMAWACMALPTADSPVYSGRPMSVCHSKGAADPKVDPAKRTVGTFGFIANTARGELAAIDFDLNRIVDLDPKSPGFNMAPTGQFPDGVGTSPDGCRVMTANRGSCDLTLFETGKLLRPALLPRRDGPAVDAGATESPAGQTVVVRTRSGTILSRPGEIAFLPQPVDALGEPTTAGCDSVGAAYPASGGTERLPWQALVTFPSCGLVGLINLPSGRLVDSVRLSSTGSEATGDDPICPVECGPAVAGAPGVPARPLVSALALLPDGTRAYVAAIDSPVVFAVDLVPMPERPYRSSGLAVPASGGRIPLREGALGVRRLRLSVNPFATIPPLTPTSPASWGGGLGSFVGGRGAFLYAIAMDGSIRVIDVARGADGQGQEGECDVNVDTFGLGDDGRKAGCHRLPADPTAPHGPRRLFVRGPGIRAPSFSVVSDGRASIPVDVAFAKLGNLADPNPLGANALVNIYDGVYAYVLFSNGDVLMANLDPKRQVNEQSVPITHVFRNALPDQIASNQSGGPPALVGVPVAILDTNDVPLSIRPPLPPGAIPRLEGVPTAGNQPLAGAAPFQLTTTYGYFPRPDEASPRHWNVAWEGILPDTARATGVFAPDPATGGTHVDDVSADFCSSGVLPGDIVQFRGCDEDAECGSTDRFSCLHVRAAAPGLCVEKSRVLELSQTCERLIASRRRYEIKAATRTRLILGAKLDELVRPSIATCAVDDDCRGIAGGAPPPNGAWSPYAKFTCEAADAGGPKRCVQRCSTTGADGECRTGFVCERIAGKISFCVEAPALATAQEAECLAQSPRYYVRAGQAFVVTGEAIPSFSTATANATTGLCEPLDRDARLSIRIPMAAPACTGVPGPEEASLASEQSVLLTPPSTAAGWPNPCLFMGPNWDEPATGARHAKALFETPELRFIVTNLEQPFGDGAQINFVTRGGYFPFSMVTQINRIAVPSRLLVGPMVSPLATTESQSLFYPYIFIVDAGRLGPSGNRGQLLRLNLKRAQFDSRLSHDVFQIQ